ncbi:MAG TPA: cytochrome c maturation protein CcmE [Caldilineaceae bacterium]|nr:cytochrome c maturation protein CcmE [Caldilineaceae bacterium]
MTQLVGRAQAIPADLATRKAANKNFKFIVGGLLIIGLVIVLIVQATISTGAYYLTVSELHQKTPAIIGERVRVSGAVVEGSEDWNAQEITLRFAISDESGEQLPIVFYGPRPDNFQRAAEAIIEGKLLPDGTFQADTLLLKCPSRYEEEPEEIFVEATR